MGKKLAVSPSQPPRAETRLSPGKAAASERLKRTGWYVEALSDARTPLEGFCAILKLLRFGGPAKTRQNSFNGFLDHGIFIFAQHQQGLNGLFCTEPCE